MMEQQSGLVLGNEVTWRAVNITSMNLDASVMFVQPSGLQSLSVHGSALSVRFPCVFFLAVLIFPLSLII